MKKALLLCLLLWLIACIAAASAEGLILKDAEGNVLEQGATLSGRFYYKVYVEGVPEDCEFIQTTWIKNVLNAEAPDEWEEDFRYLFSDEIGRYFLINPIINADYTQETMFARLDENDADWISINLLYDREAFRETEPPTLIDQPGPTVGQTDYVFLWDPVEGAEYYDIFWVAPSGREFGYASMEPAFYVSMLEGALDEVGEYDFCIIPYGDGVPFTLGSWSIQVTE